MSRPPHPPPRPSPEALLRAAEREARGQLKVFLGAAPGVGKTYEMLTDAAERRRAGVDVVIGVVETHGRAETEALLAGFEVVPRREVGHQGHRLTEMDIDAILARRPQLVLVDELAHSNAPGSRHPKRYQDVEELLAAGIDVYSTVNIQHLESLNDVVASFTRVRVRETVPDRILEAAELEVVDIPPDELIERLKAGKVYVPQEASRALAHFFSKSNLSALRELALRRAAQAVDAQMLEHVRAHALAGTWAGGERVVVAVSELPGAASLVRAAKRLADALRAPWTAVHVETPRAARFGAVERERLAATLALAGQLGGQVASVPGVSVIEGLKRFTEDARATQLVVGKSARSRWFELRHGSVVDRLVRETPGVAVHVLPFDETPESARRPSAGDAPIGPGWGPPVGYLVAAGLVALVTVIGASIYGLGDITNIGLLFLIPVMASASFHGLRPGLFAGLLSSLSYNFFFIPPRYTFTIQDPQNLITVLVLLGVAVLVSQLAARVREQGEIARRSAAQNSALAGFARALTSITDPTILGQTLCAETARLLGADTALLLPEGGELVLVAAYPPDDRLETIERAAAGWAFDHGQPAGRGSDTLTASDWLFHPIVAGGPPLGVLGTARDDGQPIRPDRLPLLHGLIDQAALALERIGLEAEMATMSQLKERDRLRAALLSSVSHDIRTPLTTILAGLGELGRGEDDGALIAAVRTEAERLNRFVANLLDMARIEAGALRLALEPVDLTDAVASAAHDLRRVLADHPIRLDVSPELPLVRVDPQLFHHILINLLDNAGKYADPGTPILVSAVRDRDGIALAVVDEGPGLPPGAGAAIFETFARLDGSDRKGGTGLGLAIVKGFAESMGLSVAAADRGDRPGARFTIRLPDSVLVKASAVIG